MPESLTISVIGCGYLGAVHAASMTELGHTVTGIDTDPVKIAALSSGHAPFFEPGLDDLLQRALASGRLRFSGDLADAAGATVHFLAVGTPQHSDSNAADMRYVDAAFTSLLPMLSPGDLVVGKSTVPVGTARRLADQLAESAPDAALAWNPEFLREGFAIHDTLHPDRLVYGLADDERSTEARAILDAVYAGTIADGTPVIVADYATAELVKVSANAFLATKISFINAMAEIAETVGADVTLLADAIGHDARIGRRFLNAGIGFGGGCLPKDIRAFSSRAAELGRGESLAFLGEVDKINLRRRQRAVDLTIEAIGKPASQGKVAVLGLAFKPDSDDVRDSPALDVATSLFGRGVRVVATDPQAIENARRLHPQLDYVATAEEAATGADAIVLVTEWADYRALDPVALRAVVASPVIIDGRNCLDVAAWRAAGWTYVGMGRP
jgi:UDPglucose 6-dehydrogenase